MQLGRPSLAEARVAEILDAFERCIARFGIEGSSLERIAEEAGVKRSILRHYVGNRDDLVVALADRVTSQYKESLRTHLLSTPNMEPTDQLLAYLFPKQTVSTAESLLVVESLIAISASSPEIRSRMQDYVEYFVTESAALLKKSYPDATRKQCWSVAYGLISICFNHESLAPLQPPPKYSRAAKAAAEALVTTLASTNQSNTQRQET
ncbi:MAG TPA: TetR/AcrR family transcriptional regulator [Planctomycetaceae bacterium]|nr:TetR/AcrR family transcriptional regulator [Planctomycetaceae bacterium]